MNVFTEYSTKSVIDCFNFKPKFNRNMTTKQFKCKCCQSGMWWVVMIVGIVMVLCGVAYWLWPIIGYTVASQLFGWMLVAVGVVQLVVSASNDRPHHWGWWLFGGMLDIFIGFVLIRNVIFTELTFAYFLSVVFIYWGVMTVFNAVIHRERRNWWVKMLNGLLMLLIGFFFIEAGFLQDMIMTSMLVALSFIYWGLTLVSLSVDMKPQKCDNSD